jgi:hypothetical protein
LLYCPHAKDFHQQRGLAEKHRKTKKWRKASNTPAVASSPITGGGSSLRWQQVKTVLSKEGCKMNSAPKLDKE